MQLLSIKTLTCFYIAIYNTIMSDIVKVKNKECFIDSEGLAYLSKLEPRAVNQLIKRKIKHLKEFGGLSLSVINHEGAKGGRPKHVYYLNEQQATLLTTFMQNSKTVTEFKKKLVREFFNMRSLLQKQETIRLAGIEVRKSLTDAVQDSGEQERMHGHGYSTYTNMVYQITGLTDLYKGWKDTSEKTRKPTFRECLFPEQLKQVELAESLIKPLLELDKQYSEIRDTLKPLFERKELK